MEQDKKSRNPIRLHFDESHETPSDSRDSLESVHVDFMCRKKFRQHKISQISDHLEFQSKSTERQHPCLPLYIVNLAIPIAISILNAFILLEVGTDHQLKCIIGLTFYPLGLVLTVISNLKLVSWKDVLRLYFHLDSIAPIFIAAISGFYSILYFFGLGPWFMKVYIVIMPIWMIYFAGTLRVMIAHASWCKWQIIFYKLDVLFCGLVSFFVGVQYMRGGYKVTNGYFTHMELMLKDLTLLYTFGIVQLFFQMYRKLSQFDQTDSLKFEYCFVGREDQENKALAEAEIKNLRHQALMQELQDLMACRLEVVPSEPSESEESESSKYEQSVISK